MAETAQVAAAIAVKLRWAMACEEYEDDDLVSDEFNRLARAAWEEEAIGRSLFIYRISHTDLCFSSYFNDPEMYKFVGLLYTSRLFQIEDNRRLCCAAAAGSVQESELLKLSHLSFHSCCSKPSDEVEDILQRVLGSTFFTHEPKRMLTLNLVRERIKVAEVVQHAPLFKHLQELEKLLAGISEIDNCGPVRELSPYETCRVDEQAFDLTDEQRSQLVDAALRNGFFRDLISLKPPQSRYISHEQALLECAEHARLWLLRAELPVYYNFGLLYSELASGDTVRVIEKEAWHSEAGFNAILPSSEEKQQRRATLACFWSQVEYGGGVIHILMPDLFVIAAKNKAKDKNKVDIFKHLACPILLDAADGGLRENVETLVFYAEASLQRIQMYDLPAKARALKQFALEKNQQEEQEEEKVPEVEAPTMVVKNNVKRRGRGACAVPTPLRKSPRLHPPKLIAVIK